MNGFDPRPRQMDKPEEGWWLVRTSQKAPWCPACIRLIETWHEPGIPENRMQRSPHLAAFISGRPVATAEVWNRRGKVITREQYDSLIAEIKSNLFANRYEPRSTPYQPVDLSRVAIPFSDHAHV